MHPVAMVRTVLPAQRTSASGARRFVRSALIDWGAQGVIDDAVLLTSELVTNAVVHAQTPVEVVCRLGRTEIQVEVIDCAPTRTVPESGITQYGDEDATGGRGLLLPAVLAVGWGVSYTAEHKTVWFRLDLGLPDSGPHEFYGLDNRETFLSRARRGSLNFLVEAGELLAGTLDEQCLLGLAAELVVPRLGPWCALYTQDETGELRLAHALHADGEFSAELRGELDRLPCLDPDVRIDRGDMICIPLHSRGRRLGMLALSHDDRTRSTGEALWLLEDLGRRIALGLDNARMFARQRDLSDALQRTLLPQEIPDIPGIEHCVVYEPAGEGFDVGGDFYDVFPVADNRWRFALGDVCGTGPQAAAVTGLVRHALRLLAREGHSVSGVLDRLNKVILEEGTRARLMTVLYGELEPRPDGGATLTLASAGHPLPLLLAADGTVSSVLTPQVLLGVVGDTAFTEEKVDLRAGDLLLCVTDGVTERRIGSDLLDDGDGLAHLLATCAGLSAEQTAHLVREAVSSFAPEPSGDDMALLVLRAR